VDRSKLVASGIGHEPTHISCGRNTVDKEHSMKNKLLISMALLAAGIAAASCEKTPSGESGADAPNQSGSTTPERQSDDAAPAQQQAQEHPDQSADQAARAANEQQSKQRQA
jgi:hypothetical protein